MQIIYEINRRFLEQVRAKFPGDQDRLSRMSIIDEYPVKQVCMAKLALVGGHAVNGVSALHTDIIKDSLFKDFHDMFPAKFVNVTNGVTPRRWLNQCNRPLSRLITSYLGPNWMTDLEQLSSLTRMSHDGEFLEKWKQAKSDNKTALAEYVRNTTASR